MGGVFHDYIKQFKFFIAIRPFFYIYNLRNDSIILRARTFFVF